MNLKVFVIGPLNTNCYVLWDKGEAVVIDPGGDPRSVIEFLREGNLKLKYIISTHGHFDHVLGVKALKAVGGKFLLNHDDVDLMPLYFDWRELPPNPDDELRDGDQLGFGDKYVIVIHTPGHTLGSTSLMLDKALFTGDTLFKGSVGRYDLGGDKEKLVNTLDLIKNMKVDEIYLDTGRIPSWKMR
ncbi:MBL fold metallo-hydrolase [Metallosphaera hakonensis]|uniref:MBL fold metallo-hydrolase n=1 Tax=Metallosphaera hakonensis TaxID=79601 RepID=UPI000A4B5684|nr:MBL fold metallo-hydrolase [Metallosphaera hakonensis]